MKKIIACWGLLMIGCFSFAQSKQIKLYQQQIEANAVYIQYLKKAVSIAKTGLTTIDDIKNDEFKLHDIFFKELSNVNKKIKSSLSNIGKIISYQLNTLKSYKKSYARIKASGQFTPRELDYIHGVFGKLLDDCSNIILELTELISDGNYKMTDGERIKHVNELFVKMQRNYQFCQKFSGNNLILAMQRLKESQETNESKKIFSEP